MPGAWRNVRQISQPDAHMYVRFGSIPSAKSDARSLLRASLETAGGWHVKSVRSASTAEAGKRQAGQMGQGQNPAQEFDFHAVAA